MMELVIKIPEEDYKNGTLINCFKCYSIELDKIIYGGTPLPRGHGRLIDAEKLSFNADTCRETTDAFVDLISEAPTILESNREKEQCNLTGEKSED